MVYAAPGESCRYRVERAMKRILAGLAAVALAAANAAPAHAQFGGPEATAVKPGFVLPAGEAGILVFRPDIAVGEQTTGGDELT